MLHKLQILCMALQPQNWAKYGPQPGFRWRNVRRLSSVIIFIRYSFLCSVIIFFAPRPPASPARPLRLLNRTTRLPAPLFSLLPCPGQPASPPRLPAPSSGPPGSRRAPPLMRFPFLAPPCSSRFFSSGCSCSSPRTPDETSPPLFCADRLTRYRYLTGTAWVLPSSSAQMNASNGSAVLGRTLG